jgi:phosphocarrier protein HPr
MIERALLIKNKLGLHARAAVKFVNTANRFEAEVRILTLAATQGSTISLRIAGPDEAAAFQALYDLVDGRFGEKE